MIAGWLVAGLLSWPVLTSRPRDARCFRTILNQREMVGNKVHKKALQLSMPVSGENDIAADRIWPRLSALRAARALRRLAEARSSRLSGTMPRDVSSLTCMKRLAISFFSP